MDKRHVIKFLLVGFFAFAMILSGCASSNSGGSKNTSPTSTGGGSTNSIVDEADEIKVGILHSLSGTMAISEVSVHDSTLMAIEEINAAGGVLGKQLVPIIEDGASEPAIFAEKARKLVANDEVATVFGGWTSASRKAMLPVFEELNGLLWYPVQYEGLEASPNIFYTGATTNQQIVPSVSWLLENRGTSFFLLGSDYVFPRTANMIIKAQLEAEGGEFVAEEYTPLGHTEYSTVISRIISTQPDVIYNTLNGDSNVAFFKQLQDAGITSDDLTVLSVSVAEEEIRGIGTDVLTGHLAAWNYFQTVDTPENEQFVASYKEAYGESRVTADPIEAGYLSVYLWAAAVEAAGTTDVDAVREAAPGISFDGPGGTVTIDGDNQHIYKKVLIGEVQEDGQFLTIYSTPEPVKPDPYLEAYDWAEGLSGQ